MKRRWFRSGMVAAAVIGLAIPLGAAAGAGAVEAGAPVAAAPALDAAPPAVDRVDGADRFDTAVQVSALAYPDGASVVYLATATGYADALSAAPAAAVQGGPLLLTRPDALPADVAAEIGRLDPDRIVVVGGPQAIGAPVVTALEQLAPTVSRIAGADRFGTSRAIAATVFADGADSAWVATGRDFPDALSAGAAAGSEAVPVLLVDGLATAIDTETRLALTGLGVESIRIAGGPAAVSSGLETALGAIAPTTRASGADRFESSTAINVAAFPTSGRAFLVTGADYLDALAGGAWAGALDAPLYAVRQNCVPAPTLDALSAQGVSEITLLGGPAALGVGVETLAACDGSTLPNPVRVPLQCDDVLDEATAENLVGTELAQPSLSGDNPLAFSDRRVGALTCSWSGPATPAAFTPAAYLSIVPEVSADDYAAVSDGVDYGGSPQIPGFDPTSREACELGAGFPVCTHIARIAGYGVQLSIVPVSKQITPALLDSSRQLFGSIADQVEDTGEPGALWHPQGADLAGVSSCDAMIGTDELGAIVGDPTMYNFRTYEGEFRIASFRSNAHVGGYGCAWSGDTVLGVSAFVLPGGAPYFPLSSPVKGGYWVATTGYPGDAWLSSDGTQVAVLVDNAWFQFRVGDENTSALPAFAAAVIENVRAAG